MKPFTKGLLLLSAVAVPPLLAATFLFGCCILPFHNDIHGSMPLCHLASEVLAGHHDGETDGDHHQATPPPSKGKRSFGFASSVETPFPVRLFLTMEATRQRLDSARQSHRSIITLGGVRCENDVGLQLLLTTFRI